MFTKLLTDNELKQIRTDIETQTMPDTCTILSGTAVADGMGGETVAWGTISTDVPFRLDARSGYVQGGAEQMSGAALRPFHEFIGTLPNSYTVTTEQRIIHSGVTYTVMSVNAGSWLACKRLILERT